MQFWDVINVILIGIIEGITEWLPVSSTGHMELFNHFFPTMIFVKNPEFKEMFMVVIQLGAILAVVVHFWHKLFPFQKKTESGSIVKTDALSLWGKVIVACLPAGVIGILFDDLLEKYLHTPAVIAAMLILYGILFIVVEDRNKKTGRLFRVDDVHQIDYKTAFLIGAFQVLSLIPGTSRSGVTILGALLIGVSRPAGAEFTFFLSIPVMLGASAIKLLKYLLLDGGIFTGAEIGALLLGSGVAFLLSLFAIRFLMNFVKKHDFKPFGIYRIALGVAVLLLLVIIPAL